MYYKLIDIKNDKPYTLFHGVEGTKELPTETWIKADKKKVIDGSGGTEYLSGFHVLKSYEECLSYLNNFTNIKNKGIAFCNAQDIRPKKHSRSNIYLADSIYINRIEKI